MVKSLISWVVVGIFAYAWYWTGYSWDYLQNVPRGDWKPTWILVTLFVVLVNRRPGGAAAIGANVIETIMNRIKGVAPHFLGLVLSLAVGLTLWSLHQGGFIVNEYAQGLALIVTCNLITTIWLAALDDATQ